MKTKDLIINAFSITVKNLCKKAHISVSSFYTYYQDIYHLSHKLETQVANNIFDKLKYINEIYDKPELFISQFMLALSANENMIRILSSDHHSTIIDYLYIQIKEYLDINYPEYTHDNHQTITLSYLIYGMLIYIQKTFKQLKTSSKKTEF